MFTLAGQKELWALDSAWVRAVFDRDGIQPQEQLREAIARLENAIRTRFGRSQESEQPRETTDRHDLVDSIVLGGGGPCWIRTSDQRIMSRSKKPREDQSD